MAIEYKKHDPKSNIGFTHEEAQNKLPLIRKILKGQEFRKLHVVKDTQNGGYKIVANSDNESVQDKRDPLWGIEK